MATDYSQYGLSGGLRQNERTGYHPESGYIQKLTSEGTARQRRSATIKKRLLVLSLILGLYLTSSLIHDPLSPAVIGLIVSKCSTTTRNVVQEMQDSFRATVNNALARGVPTLPRQEGRIADFKEALTEFSVLGGLSVEVLWFISVLEMLYYAARVCLWGCAAQNVYALLRLDSVHNIYAKSTVMTTRWTLHASGGQSISTADLCWGTLWYFLNSAATFCLASLLFFWTDGVLFWLGCLLLQYMLWLNIRHLYLRLLPLLFTQAVLAVQQVADFCFAGHNSVLWHNEKLVHKSLTGIFVILVVLDKYLSVNVMAILLQLVSWLIGTIIV